MKKIILLLSIISCFQPSVSAQNIFTGIIKDAGTKKILHAVTVQIEGTKKTVASDSNGRVVINNLSAGEIKIILSFVGYEDQVISLRIPQSSSIILRTLMKSSAPGINLLR